MANPAEAMEIDDDEPAATTTAPVANANDNDDVVEAVPPPAATAPAFAATPRKLYDLPEIADRYATIVSTLKDVVYRDPSKFSLKPPCWDKWKADEYRKLADYLECFDLVPLARELGKSVEEVYHMYHGVVTKPLYKACTASNKGVHGMQGWFELYNKHGTPSRVWAENEDKCGELDNITSQTIHLILQKSGYKCRVKLEELREDDLEWIQENVELPYRRILSGLAAGKNVKYKTDDGLPPNKTLKRKLPSEPETPSKQARLAENGNATAPAKMRTTPSAFAATPQPPRTSRNPLETPTNAPKKRQPSAAVEAPTPSKALAVAAPSTPEPTKIVTLQVGSSEQFANRSWTAAGVVARFSDIVPGFVVLVERRTLRRFTVPLSALVQVDKDWLNDKRRESLIEKASLMTLKQGEAPTYVYRYWTNRREVVIARYVFMSRMKIHVELEEECEGRIISIPFEELNEQDRVWLKEHINQYDLRTMSDYEAKKAAEEAKVLAEAAQDAEETTTSSSTADYVVIDSASDQDADHESQASDVVRTQKRARRPAENHSVELADRSMSVAIADPDATMAEEDEEDIEVARPGTSAQDLAVRAASRAPDATTFHGSFETAQESPSEAGGAMDETYEAITGAPIRHWTDFNLVGNLVAIAERKVFLRVQGRDEHEQLPMERWSEGDKAWIREYLVKDQKKILSGKAKVGVAA